MAREVLTHNGHRGPFDGRLSVRRSLRSEELACRNRSRSVMATVPRGILPFRPTLYRNPAAMCPVESPLLAIQAGGRSHHRLTPIRLSGPQPRAYWCEISRAPVPSTAGRQHDRRQPSLEAPPNFGQSSIETVPQPRRSRSRGREDTNCDRVRTRGRRLPMANSELISAAVQNSQLFRVRHVGHAVHLEAPHYPARSAERDPQRLTPDRHRESVASRLGRTQSPSGPKQQ